LRFAAKVPSNREQVRLVTLEEAQQSGEERRIGGTSAQLVSPDSGQVDEPLRPTLAPKRCRKSGESNRDRVIVVCARQRLHAL